MSDLHSLLPGFLVGLHWVVAVLLLGVAVRLCCAMLPQAATARAAICSAALVLVALVPLTAWVEVPTVWQLAPVEDRVEPRSELRSSDPSTVLMGILPPELQSAPTPETDSIFGGEAREPRTPPLAWVIAVVAAIWIVGASWTFFRQLVSRVRLRRFLAESEPVPPDVEKEIRATIERVFDRSIAFTMRAHPDATSPFVCGIARPILVLPMSIDRVDHPHLRSIVLHEAAHLIRRDLWVGGLELGLQVPLWFHPALRWIRGELSRAREEACDNHVLREVSGRTYSRVLFEIASPARMEPSPVRLGILEPHWSLEDRILGLIDERRVTMTRTPVRPLLSSTALLLALVTGVMFVQPRLVVGDEEDKKAVSSSLSPADETASLRLAKQVEMRFDGVSWQRGIEIIEDSAGVEVQLDELGTIPGTVVVSQRERPLSEFLFRVLFPNFLDYRLKDGSLEIGQAPNLTGEVDPRSWPTTEDTAKFEKALAEKSRAWPSETPLGKVLEHFEGLGIPVILHFDHLAEEAYDLEAPLGIEVEEGMTRREVLSALAKKRSNVVLEHRGVTLVTGFGVAVTMRAMFAAAEIKE